LWATVLAADTSSQTSAKVSPPDVGFQVVAEHDVLNRGRSFDVVFSITNRSEIPLENLQILMLPKDPKGEGSKTTDSTIHFTSPPMLDPIPPFGSQNPEAAGRVGKDADFQTYHEVFVLQYTWKAGATQHLSKQNATLNIQVNRQFEDEAKGLPGGTAALLYMILPIMTLFLAYGIADSLRQGNLKIPEFKSEYIATAFLLAILFNFLLIIEWQKDLSYLYATPQQFAKSVALLAAVGAAYPFLRWLNGVCFHTFRPNDSKENYLKKVLHQSKNGEVRWTKATISGVACEGALLEQPNGAKALGACLQVSPKSSGSPTAEELKKIVDEHGSISNKQKLLNYVEQGAVTLAFSRKIVQSGKQMETLFVKDKAMIVSSNGAEDERIIKFVN